MQSLTLSTPQGYFTGDLVNQEMSAKRRRVVLSMSQKLHILERLDKGEKAVELSAEYSVGKSTIAAIKKSKHELREFVAGMEEYQGYIYSSARDKC